jgi:hypothetical protein
MQVHSTPTPAMRAPTNIQQPPTTQAFSSALCNLLALVSHSPPLQDSLPVAVQFQLDHGEVAGADPDGGGLSIDFFLCHALNVDDPFFSVDRGYTAFAAFEGSAGDEHFVVFADRDGADLTSVTIRHQHSDNQRNNRYNDNDMQRKRCNQDKCR